jgi:hypothetical protein
MAPKILKKLRGVLFNELDFIKILEIDFEHVW